MSRVRTKPIKAYGLGRGYSARARSVYSNRVTCARATLVLALGEFVPCRGQQDSNGRGLPLCQVDFWIASILAHLLAFL